MQQSTSRAGSTAQRLLTRSCEALLGMAAGMLADGRLSDEEIRFLDVWLADNEQLATTWPGEAVYAAVAHVLEDGVITEDERIYLTDTLSKLIGGTLEQTGGAAGGLSTTLPLDDVQHIEFAGNSFCFTGQFIYGTRPKCEAAVGRRGGLARPSVTKQLHYLVIGELASREWAHSSHGRKIEKAKANQAKGSPVKVVSEQMWVEAMRQFPTLHGTLTTVG